jgi:hypothetical protein
MVNVRNITSNKLEVAFNFNTYVFDPKKIVAVEDDVCEHLKDRYPMAFDFNVYVKKSDPEPKVAKSFKTPVYSVPPRDSDMNVTNAGMQSSTFSPTAEVDNPGFYGAGLEVDNLIE